MVFSTFTEGFGTNKPVTMDDEAPNFPCDMADASVEEPPFGYVHCIHTSSKSYFVVV